MANAESHVETSRLIPVVVVAAVMGGVGMTVVPPTAAAMLGWALVTCAAVFVTIAICFVLIP